MTLGQLFAIMHPDVKVVENGSCVWLFFDIANHYTMKAEWWNQEIPEMLSYDNNQKNKNKPPKEGDGE